MNTVPHKHGFSYVMLGPAVLLLTTLCTAEEAQTVVVNSGHVVVQGQYLPPPYTITLKPGPVRDDMSLDTVFINGIAVLPYVKTETELFLSRLRTTIRDSVKTIVIKHTVAQAKPYIEDFLEAFSKRHPIIDTWRIMYSGSRENYTVFLYDKSEEFVALITYPLFREGFVPDSNAPSVPLVAKKTLREHHIDKCQHYAQRLREGEVLTFGFYCPFPENQIARLRKVRSILMADVSDSTKKQLLKEMGIAKLSSHEFIENKEQWRKLRLEEDK